VQEKFQIVAWTVILSVLGVAIILGGIATVRKVLVWWNIQRKVDESRFSTLVEIRDLLSRQQAEFKAIRDNQCQGSLTLLATLVEIRDLLAKQQAEPPKPSLTEDERQALLALPKMVEGWIKISEEQVAQTAKLVEAVTAFRKTLFHSEGGDFTESSEAEASREYEIQQILKERGCDRDSAEGILNNRSVWEELKL